jgi:hypothetical protein
MSGSTLHRLKALGDDKVTFYLDIGTDTGGMLCIDASVRRVPKAGIQAPL